jgi:D-serine deaminase-like pyridoxal phosphate-dependent protein
VDDDGDLVRADDERDARHDGPGDDAIEVDYVSAALGAGHPSSLDQLATPFLYVDLDRMKANIDTMAAAARGLGVRLRPHAKTHKVPDIARLQIAAGATGITLAKISEAEVFADAGIDDVFVAYEIVAPAQLGRLLRLARRVHLRCAVDSREGAEALSGAATAAGIQLQVMLEIDLGIGRTGVRAGVAACELAQRITDLPRLELIGVYGFRGFRAFAEGAETREAWGRAEGEALASAADDLRAIGLPIVEVSAGSTPTALPAATVRGVTEIRPGQYLFGCANVVAQGAMRADDVALLARSTVISRPADDRAVVDAGSKTLSTDGPWEPGRGFGYLASDSSTRVVSVWEEHGVLGLGENSRGLRIGDRVSIVPNHVCTAINLHDRLVGVHEDRIEAVWKIAARGRLE